MLSRLLAVAAIAIMSGCASLPPPVGATVVAWVKGPVDPEELSGALAAARARYPGRSISEKDLVQVGCGLDDFAEYSGNAVAPAGQRLSKETIVRIRVGTPLMGITASHLDEVLSVLGGPGEIPTTLPRARNGKLIAYPPEVAKNYIGSTGSSLVLSCMANL